MSLGKTKTNKTNPDIYISYDNILMFLDGWDRESFLWFLEEDLA